MAALFMYTQVVFRLRVLCFVLCFIIILHDFVPKCNIVTGTSLLDLQLLYRLRVYLAHAVRDEERQRAAQRGQGHYDDEEDLPDHHVVVDAEVFGLVVRRRCGLPVLEYRRVPRYRQQNG